ncbi:MAG: hypothetical protein C9356_12070 [Oleiphilus sp.]|nr:MAG: hypothetical protein C9356_12070 [Oleiphilus sp.]
MEAFAKVIFMDQGFNMPRVLSLCESVRVEGDLLHIDIDTACVIDRWAFVPDSFPSGVHRPEQLPAPYREAITHSLH